MCTSSFVYTLFSQEFYKMLSPLPCCQKQEALSELFMSYLGQMKCQAVIPAQFNRKLQHNSY